MSARESPIITQSSKWLSFQSSSDSAPTNPVLSSSSLVERSPADRKNPQHFGAPKNHASRFIARCLCLFLPLCVFVIILFWDFETDLEDQLCSVKKWQYPTCLPRAEEILHHSPSPEDWVEFRDAFRRAVVKPEHFSLDPVNWTNGSKSGFTVPISIQRSEERGRGVYADAFIPEGTMIWDNRYTARVRNECEAKRFVHELTNDQACSALIWGYAIDHGTGKLEWAIDLDPASFINEGKTPNEINVEDRVVDPTMALIPGGHSTWTLRDIAEGEELLLSYAGLGRHEFRPSFYWNAKAVFRTWGPGPFLF